VRSSPLDSFSSHCYKPWQTDSSVNIQDTFSAIIGLCDEITGRAIDVSNVCTLLEQSDENNTPMVRRACLSFIAREFKTVKKTPGYQQLSEVLKEQILQLVGPSAN
jgi:hypothetical protein